MAEFKARVACFGFRNRLWAVGDVVKNVTKPEYEASNGMYHFDANDDEARAWRDPVLEQDSDELKEVERVEIPASPDIENQIRKIEVTWRKAEPPKPDTIKPRPLHKPKPKQKPKARKAKAE
jgi:hypothetical protein